MTELFQWRCLILDDDPTDVEDLSAHLARHGIRCDIRPREDTDDAYLSAVGRTAADLVEAADVVLVDMLWRQAGRQGTDHDAAQILRYGIARSKDRFRAWCEAHATAPTPRGPGVDRGDEYVGYVLGAAISQFNPRAKLIFCSSVAPTEWRSLVETLQHFEPSPYAICQKRRGPAAERVFAALEELQRRLVRENRELARWFVGQVVLPLCVGLEPEPTTCSTIWPEESGNSTPDRWRLEPAKVFPQFLGGPRRQSDGLIGLLPQTPWRLSPAERQAVEALKHTVARWQAHPETIAKYRLQLRSQCAAAGAAGQRALAAVSKAVDAPTKEHLDAAIAALSKATQEDMSPVEMLCEEHGGRLDFEPSILRDATDVRASNIDSAFDTLGPPFDPFQLRLAVESLVDNLEKLAAQEGFTASRRLDAYVRRDSISITYVDNSPGFPTLEALARSLNISLRRSQNALDRGLPLALSFPFFYPVLGAAVRLTANGWHTLYGDCAPSTEYESSEWGFGVHWRFKLEPSETQRGPIA